MDKILRQAMLDVRNQCENLLKQNFIYLSEEPK